MSITSSLNMATNALSAAQSAISVVSNNISNVNNENYSKLNVHMSDSVKGAYVVNSTTEIADSLTGVNLESIDRSANEYLESYSRSKNSDVSYYSTSASIATSVQDVTNELSSNSSGLSSAISAFYTAASALADNPSDASLRSTYESKAEAVCSYFNDSYNSLSNTEQSLVGDYNVNGSCQGSEIDTDLSGVNLLFDQLANVNSTIIQTNSDTTINSSLLDTRNEILKKLSSYADLDTSVSSNGTATVSLGGHTLVSGNSVKGYLQATTGSGESEPVKINIVTDPDSHIASNIQYTDVGDSIKTGAVGAILDITCSSRSSGFTISSVVDKLNTLANTFATAVNTLQSGSTTADGTNTTYAMCLNSSYTQTAYSSTNMFVNNTVGAAASESAKIVNINAGNISINSSIKSNLNLIATTRTSSASGGESSNIGGNTNLTYIGNTKTTSYTALGNQTFSNFIATTDTSIGTQVSSLTSNTKNATSVASSIDSKLSSAVGVNMDEELSKLIQYQQMYQAAAQVFSTCNGLLETLMNMAK